MKQETYLIKIVEVNGRTLLENHVKNLKVKIQKVLIKYKVKFHVI